MSQTFALQPVNFAQPSSFGQARACVKIFPGGSISPQVFNIKQYRIEKNCHGATNTASFELPYAGNPDWTGLLLRGNGAAVADDVPIYVEIWAGFPQNPSSAPDTGGLSRRFHGIIDSYSAKDIEKTTFNCRSIAAPLCTDKISTSVQNLTTLQFIQQIAAQYDIEVNAETSNAPVKLASVYGHTLVVGLKNLFKWDVLVRSSACDDVDLWEDDGVLNYVSPWTVERATLSLIYGVNVLSFTGSHSPQFNRNIEVFVHSHSDFIRTAISTRVRTLLNSPIPGIEVSQNARVSYATPQWGTNNVTTTTYTQDGQVSTRQSSTTGGSVTGSNASISDSGKERYEFYAPNLTAAEASDRAIGIARQISMHEYHVEIKLAMTPDFLPNCLITSLLDFSGYGMAAFNTKYWPRQMTESFAGAEASSADAGGWIVTYVAVNSTPPIGGN